MSHQPVTYNRRQLFGAILGSVSPIQSLSVAPASTTPPISTIAFNRMGFGPSAGDLDAFNALGENDLTRLYAYIEQQLNPELIDDSACEARITEEIFPTINKNRTALWTEHHQIKKQRGKPLSDMQRLKLLRAVHSKRQLVEVLVEFWHDHFSVHGAMTPIRSLITAYDRDVIRPNVLGNFREFLIANAKSPCMLFYLDNISNRKQGPNENYARELCELHTMGEAAYLGTMAQADVPGYPDAPIGYVEDDVFEIAKCFTGWGVAKKASQGTVGEYRFFANKHETGAKSALGMTIPANQEGDKDALDILNFLATHPATARHIATKLCRRLIADQVPADVVESAAAVFLEKSAEPDQLKHVVRHILQSEAFRTTWGSKFKRPFEVAVSALRALGANATYAKSEGKTKKVLRSLSAGGHAAFGWTPPNGYPDVAGYWQGSNGFVARWRMFNMMTVRSRNAETATPDELITPNQIVDYWTDQIFGYPLSAEDRATIVAFFADGGDPDAPLARNKKKYKKLIKSGVALMLCSADFQQR